MECWQVLSIHCYAFCNFIFCFLQVKGRFTATMLLDLTSARNTAPAAAPQPSYSHFWTVRWAPSATFISYLAQARLNSIQCNCVLFTHFLRRMEDFILEPVHRTVPRLLVALWRTLLSRLVRALESIMLSPLMPSGYTACRSHVGSMPSFRALHQALGFESELFFRFSLDRTGR